MILDANQARKRAYSSTPAYKTIESIMRDIAFIADRGHYTMVYPMKKEGRGVVQKVISALQKLGYAVEYDSNTTLLHIDWSEKQ